MVLYVVLFSFLLSPAWQVCVDDAADFSDALAFFAKQNKMVPCFNVQVMTSSSSATVSAGSAGAGSVLQAPMAVPVVQGGTGPTLAGGAAVGGGAATAATASTAAALAAPEADGQPS